jgi:hypothetical protein
MTSQSSSIDDVEAVKYADLNGGGVAMFAGGVGALGAAGATAGAGGRGAGGAAGAAGGSAA